jgi:hypothetical protein
MSDLLGSRRPALASPRFVLVLALALVGVGGAALASRPELEEVPGPALAARVEAELARRPDPFANDPSHQVLVAPVSQPVLLEFMRQIRTFGAPDEVVLGTAHGLETHGGGLLHLLFSAWRPDARAARMADTFRFEPDGAGVPLAVLYASLRQQVFLPVPSVAGVAGVAGVATIDIDGALRDASQLPRMRFRVAGEPPAEVDAYHFLRLMIAHEPDLAATWRNHGGQDLSANRVLDHTRDVYLASRDTPAEPADHSRLHLVEVLLEASRRRGQSPDAVQRHFLAVELGRETFDPRDETLLLGHYTESLGLLLADPRTRWNAEQRRHVRAWLSRLDGRFPDVESVPGRRLAHLLRGLRLVEAHADRLR